jgi:linoleoyl-CoA desaturase
MSSVKFNNSEPVFFNTLKDRINTYFSEKNVKPTGDFRLYLKTFTFVGALIASYIVLVFFTPSAWYISLGLCAIMGGLLAGIGFNVMHDGAHGSYSNIKWLNETMGYALNMMGGSNFLWKQKHNINHHSYTNVEGMDDDIDIKPFIRVHSSQKKYWFHRYQHVYGLLLYGLTYLAWIFLQDFKKYFSGKIADNTKIQRMSVKEHIIFWSSKVFYVGAFLVLPMYNIGVIDTIIGYSIMVFITGVIIAVVFQLAHVVEDAEFVTPVEPMRIESEWAIHQINTTVNFAMDNKMWCWLLGGLNFQVEHHLFPRISHVHYPQISKIVRATCVEFNIAYKEFPTFRSALRSHLIHLKRIGVAA